MTDYTTNSQWGIRCLYLAGLMLILIGLVALATAVSITFLPHETVYLQATAVSLNHTHHDHSLAGFITHNRIAFAGTLITLGWLYIWLTHYSIRQGQPWAWGSLLISALCGSSSFFAYLSRGYFDPWHALGTVVISAVLTFGLWHTYPLKQAIQPSGRSTLTTRLNSPVRLLAAIWAIGNLLGGIGIFLTGLWPVFVPQDLAYMQTTTNALQQISPHLIPFIAHDRSGFGGALCALGIVLTACLWFMNEPQLNDTWPHLSAIWLINVLTAIVIHLFVGYNSLSHLLPFIIKDSAFLLACLMRLWKQHSAPLYPVRSRA